MGKALLRNFIVSVEILMKFYCFNKDLNFLREWFIPPFFVSDKLSGFTESFKWVQASLATSEIKFDQVLQSSTTFEWLRPCTREDK